VTPGSSLLKAPELCHAANASQFVPGGYSGSWPAEYIIIFLGGIALIRWISEAFKRHREKIRDHVAAEVFNGLNIDNAIENYKQKLVHLKKYSTSHPIHEQIQAKAENVTSHIDRLALQLLRRHIVQRSDDLSWECTFEDSNVVLANGENTVHLCEPEIEQDDPIFRNEDVGWFEVTVSDPCEMSIQRSTPCGRMAL